MLKKKPAGRDTMDLRQEVMVWRIGKPFEAFSIMALQHERSVSFASSYTSLFLFMRQTYRSMIVINGHVSAPAVAALATSTPSRSPRSFVFHIGAPVVFAGEGAVAVATGPWFGAECATGRSTVAIAKEVSCATASRVILMQGMG